MPEDSPHLSTWEKQTGRRPKLLDAVSSWLKLLALIVVSVEAVLVVGLVSGPEQDPLKGLYIPLMLLFFSIIVVGLFFDRYIQLRGQPPRVQLGPEQAPTTPEYPTVANRVRDEVTGSEESHVITVQRTGKKLHVVLSDDVAIVSSKLRAESLEKIFSLIVGKIRVHTHVFQYPNPSAIIPINDRYFGRFAWDDATVTCCEIFEIPEDSDIEQWKQWCRMQTIYVEAYASAHRQPEHEVTRRSLEDLARELKAIHCIAQEIITHAPNGQQRGTEVLLAKLQDTIENLDYEDRSKSPSNVVIRLENGLSTAHDIIRRLMPRVITI